MKKYNRGEAQRQTTTSLPTFGLRMSTHAAARNVVGASAAFAAIDLRVGAPCCDTRFDTPHA